MTYLSSFFGLSPPFAGIPFDFRYRATIVGFLKIVGTASDFLLSFLCGSPHKTVSVIDFKASNRP